MKNSSRFFRNSDCEYFPCHKVTDTENFNCLFCYCPLYYLKHCPGNHEFIPNGINGIKDCSNCTLPHTDYDAVMKVLLDFLLDKVNMRITWKDEEAQS